MGENLVWFVGGHRFREKRDVTSLERTKPGKEHINTSLTHILYSVYPIDVTRMNSIHKTPNVGRLSRLSNTLQNFTDPYTKQRICRPIFFIGPRNLGRIMIGSHQAKRRLHRKNLRMS